LESAFAFYCRCGIRDIDANEIDFCFPDESGKQILVPRVSAREHVFAKTVEVARLK
jgi:hypothetical protein